MNDINCCRAQNSNNNKNLSLGDATIKNISAFLLVLHLSSFSVKERRGGGEITE